MMHVLRGFSCSGLIAKHSFAASKTQQQPGFAKPLHHAAAKSTKAEVETEPGLSRLLDAFVQIAEDVEDLQPPQPVNSMRPDAEVLQTLQDLLLRVPPGHTSASAVGRVSHTSSSHCVNCCAPLWDTTKPAGLCQICDHSPAETQNLIGANAMEGRPPGQGTWAAALAEQAARAEAASTANNGSRQPAASQRVVLVSDEHMLLHRVALPPHFERPERLQAIWHRFAKSGLFERCHLVASRQATDAELTAVHTRRLIDSLAATASSSTAHAAPTHAASSSATMHNSAGSGSSDSSNPAAQPGGLGSLEAASHQTTNPAAQPGGLGSLEAPSHQTTNERLTDESSLRSSAASGHGAQLLSSAAASVSATAPAADRFEAYLAPTGMHSATTADSDMLSHSSSGGAASEMPTTSTSATTAASHHLPSASPVDDAQYASVASAALALTSAPVSVAGSDTMIKLMQQGMLVSGSTYEAARLAAGSAAQLATMLVRGEADSGVAIVRPPGHHASADEAHGGCFFNSVAVAVRAAQAAGAERVMVLDWGVHSGHGTQSIFANDNSVLYISMHRLDEQFYPAASSAAMDQLGSGKGRHHTLNMAWSGPGITDGDCMNAMLHVVLPTAQSFQPDVVIVSAGFDAAEGEIMGGCSVTAPGYGHMLSLLQPLAPTMLVLEGGYNLNGISRCLETCVRVMLGERPPRLPYKMEASEGGWTAVVNALQIQGKYWDALYNISWDGWSDAVRKAQQEARQKQLRALQAMQQGRQAAVIDEAEHDSYEEQGGEYADFNEDYDGTQGTKTDGSLR